MKSAILLELNGILILTKVKLAIEASAVGFQESKLRSTTSDCFMFQIVFSLEMLRIPRTHSRLRQSLGKDKNPLDRGQFPEILPALAVKIEPSNKIERHKTRWTNERS